jgi:hypothetical protein
MVIETPKQKDATLRGQADPLDDMNLRTLRSLLV